MTDAQVAIGVLQRLGLCGGLGSNESAALLSARLRASSADCPFLVSASIDVLRTSKGTALRGRPKIDRSMPLPIFREQLSVPQAM